MIVTLILSAAARAHLYGRFFTFRDARLVGGLVRRTSGRT